MAWEADAERASVPLARLLATLIVCSAIVCAGAVSLLFSAKAGGAPGCGRAASYRLSWPTQQLQNVFRSLGVTLFHNEISENAAMLPLADYLLELKLCLEADEEYFLLTSNPDFMQGVIEKNELLGRVSASGAGKMRHLIVP